MESLVVLPSLPPFIPTFVGFQPAFPLFPLLFCDANRTCTIQIRIGECAVHQDAAIIEKIFNAARHPLTRCSVLVVSAIWNDPNLSRTFGIRCFGLILFAQKRGSHPPVCFSFSNPKFLLVIACSDPVGPPFVEQEGIVAVTPWVIIMAIRVLFPEISWWCGDRLNYRHGLTHGTGRPPTAIKDNFAMRTNLCTHFQLSSSRSPANGSVISVMSVIWPRPIASSAAYIASSSAASSGSIAWAVSHVSW